MSIRLESPTVPPARGKRLSEILRETAAGLPPGDVSLRDVLTRVGEHGLLLFCILLAVPYLQPIPLPFLSTVSGVLIALIGLGVTFNRIPWLPRAIMERRMASSRLGPLLERGAGLLVRVERFLHPRWTWAAAAPVAHRLSGALLVLCALFLSLPLPIPGTNLLPAWAIVLLAAGMMERDGCVVLAGSALGAAAMGFLAILVYSAVLGGAGLWSLGFGSPR